MQYARDERQMYTRFELPTVTQFVRVILAQFYYSTSVESYKIDFVDVVVYHSDTVFRLETANVLEKSSISA